MNEQLLAPLNLPPAAQRWLIDFFWVIQGLDDWRDNDPVEPKQKEKVIYQKTEQVSNLSTIHGHMTHG